MEFQTETASLEHGTSSRNETAYLVCKRAFDIAASFCALVVLSPVFLIIYLIIYLDDPHGNPIFSQIRIGKNGKAFRIYKFRSMVVNAEDLLAGLQNQNEMSGPAFKMKNDPRVTKVGRFIRKTSLDELPQLWNVLKGDMSLVGPRPPLPNEVEQYTEEQKKRLSVTPGLTCYWQVQPSRNDLDFGEWFELDMKYPQVLENIRVTDKKAAQNDPAVQEAVSKVAEALGDTGRILVRESGTEPVVRVMVEAPDHNTCQKYVDEVVNVICEKGYKA